jgi:hypothetical protein
MRLVSPVDGIVTARLVEPGTTVVAGQAVVQVIDPSSLWVRRAFDQGQSGALRRASGPRSCFAPIRKRFIAETCSASIG